jgi:hypothetical protein
MYGADAFEFDGLKAHQSHEKQKAGTFPFQPLVFTQKPKSLSFGGCSRGLPRILCGSVLVKCFHASGLTTERT